MHTHTRKSTERGEKGIFRNGSGEGEGENRKDVQRESAAKREKECVIG